MSEKTKIQWCDHTFNPWIGCTKVSPGCANCYAEISTPSRVRGIEWGEGKTRERTSPANWKEPLRWNQAAAGKAIRPRVFCASLSDWLDDEVPIEWLADLLRLIYDTPNLDWLLLTKRPENWRAKLHKIGNDITMGVMRYGNISQWARQWIYGEPPANVWIGTTVEDQLRADQRLPELIKIPAVVRFVSAEPLIASVDFTHVNFPTGVCENLINTDAGPRARRVLGEDFKINGIDWIIVGGESGPSARPCRVDWVRSIVRQCNAHSVACFVKQLGAKPLLTPCRQHYFDWTYKTSNESRPDDELFTEEQTAPGLWRVLLKDRKGGEPSEWPEDLRVREFPKMNVLLCPQNLH